MHVLGTGLRVLSSFKITKREGGVAITGFILNLENLENLENRPFLQKVRENLE